MPKGPSWAPVAMAIFRRSTTNSLRQGWQVAFYREAAEVLSTSFKAKGGSVSTDLGGRIPRESKLFTELVADERRASIFAPTAADDADTAAHLAALLEFYQELKAPTPDENAVSAAADSFVKGDDPMRVHRQLYAASELLDRKLALPKVVELAKAAVENVDVAVGSPSASTAVMAGELYSPRAIAATRGEYVNVPDVPRATLSAIVRGRIEDMMGWAAYQTGATDDAVLHLRRAGERSAGGQCLVAGQHLASRQPLSHCRAKMPRPSMLTSGATRARRRMHSGTRSLTPYIGESMDRLTASSIRSAKIPPKP